MRPPHPPYRQSACYHPHYQHFPCIPLHRPPEPPGMSSRRRRVISRQRPGRQNSREPSGRLRQPCGRGRARFQDRMQVPVHVQPHVLEPVVRMTCNVCVGPIEHGQIAPKEQFSSNGLGGFIIALLEVAEHFFVGVLECILHVLIEVDTWIHVQVVVGAGWSVRVETVAEGDSLGIADGIIGVGGALRDLRSGGAVLSRRRDIGTSVLYFERMVRLLLNRITCASLDVEKLFTCEEDAVFASAAVICSS